MKRLPITRRERLEIETISMVPISIIKCWRIVFQEARLDKRKKKQSQCWNETGRAREKVTEEEERKRRRKKKEIKTKRKEKITQACAHAIKGKKRAYTFCGLDADSRRSREH